MKNLFLVQARFVCLTLFVIASLFFSLSVKATGKRDKNVRDPFWPVGYVSKRVIQSGPEKKGPVNWEEARKNIKINGIVRKKDEYVVIINNRVKKIGDTVTFNFKGHCYRWVIESITPPRSVKLRAEKGSVIK